MKAMNELTRLGKLRRARKIILEGLECYDMKIERLQYLCEATNIFYKLVDQAGNRYAVKLYEELSSDFQDNKIEMFLLKAIGATGEIIVPEVVTNKAGDAVTSIETKWDTIVKRIAVYKWIDGVDFDGRETPQHFHALGQVMAKLHNITEDLPLEQFSPKKQDCVLYFAGDDYFYKEEKYQKYVSKRYHEVMDFIMPKLDDQLAAMYQEKAQLIHGDFNPWNIKLYNKQLQLMDFEDATLGYPIHDIAILFYYYRDHEATEDFQKAFYKGYSSVRELDAIDPEQLEMLMTARDVNFLNYILPVSDDPTAYIERQLNRLEGYVMKRYPEFKARKKEV